MTEIQLLHILSSFQIESLDRELHSYGYEGSVTEPYASSKLRVDKDKPASVAAILRIFKFPLLKEVHVENHRGDWATVITLVADKAFDHSDIIQAFIKSCCSEEVQHTKSYPHGWFGSDNYTVVIPFASIYLNFAKTAHLFGADVDIYEPDTNDDAGTYEYDDEAEDIEIDLEDNPLALDFPPPTDVE